MLLVSKKGPMENGWIDICASIDAPGLIPENKKAVRAVVPIGGYYVERIPKTKEGNVSKVISIGASRLGGSIPLSLIKKMAATSIVKFGRNMTTALKDYLRK
jgi:hypothetical protein